MSLTQPLLPAKTSIPVFPENPKTLILKQCKTTRDLNQVHAHLIKTRLHLNPSVTENILESAAILLPLPTMDYALSIFRRIKKPNCRAYNVMIRGFTSKQSYREAILLLQMMVENSVSPDEFTFICTLKACSRIRALKEGRQIHSQFVKFGFGLNGFFGNSLINLYAVCGEFEVARKVFDKMSERDVVAWGAMLSGYSKGENWEEVLHLFQEMRESDAEFDEVSLIMVTTACGRLGCLEVGEWIGEFVDANGLKGNIALITSLIDMYAKCGRLEAAKRLFDQMERRDVVTWSAMISGYSQARQCKEALDLFHEMQLSKIEPNEVTMVSVLSSCATLGALKTGKWIHSYTKHKKMKLTLTLGTSLMDFYAKCGLIDNALEIFAEMPHKNVFSWTVLIQGLANNGHGGKALEFFYLMQKNKVEPNYVTFLGVLSACSHVGLVDEGRKFFVAMSRDFGIEPRTEHYGCMVDILGRAGLVEEAYEFIKNMPIQPNAVIWRTLLASCRAHKCVELGEKSIKQIVNLEPLHSGDYILLSNIYASVGRLEDARKVYQEMREKRIKKQTKGCSLIELDLKIYEFSAVDNSNPHNMEVYPATEEMMRKIKSAGYMPSIDDARIDAEEDDKEAAVSHHSEKLAIAFGLIKTAPGTTIRISKNLRVCTDCHNATKIISKVYCREIIVRDRNRFHHFRDGVCSCNDYW